MWCLKIEKQLWITAMQLSVTWMWTIYVQVIVEHCVTWEVNCQPYISYNQVMSKNKANYEANIRVAVYSWCPINTQKKHHLYISKLNLLANPFCTNSVRHVVIICFSVLRCSVVIISITNFSKWKCNRDINYWIIVHRCIVALRDSLNICFCRKRVGYRTQVYP